MYEKKHTIVVATFNFLAAAMVTLSFIGTWDGGVYKEIGDDLDAPQSSNDSFLKGVEYFITEEGKKVFSLDADELTLDNHSKKSLFIRPKGLAYTQAGEKVFYEGLRGVYDQADQMLTLNEKVKLNTNDTEALADHMFYDIAKNEVIMDDNVKTKTFYAQQGDWVFLDSQKAYFWPYTEKSRYVGNVSGLIKRKHVYEDSLNFESNDLYLNMATHKADLNGDVKIVKQSLKATSRRGEIFLENYNKKLKYFVLYDDVKVIEKVMLDGKFTQRKAFSEKLEGLPSEGKVILTGYPKVYQLNDVIKGNRIVLRQNSEVVEVDDANSNFKVE